MRILNRITGPFREFGAAAGTLYAIDRVLSSLSSQLRLYVYELMVQPITDRELLPPSVRTRISIREIWGADPEIALMPVRPEVMADRLRQGAHCLGAFRDGSMIGYMWFSRGRYDEDEVRCTYLLNPEPEAVFDFDFYIFPEHRLGLGFAALWSGANEFLFQQGVRYTFSRLTRFNLASRRAHRHLGWKLAGRALFLKVRQVQLMLATTSPWVHLSWRDTDRVRLSLHPHALTAPNMS